MHRRAQRRDYLANGVSGDGKPPLPLPDDLRLKGAVPVPRHLDADLAGALGQHRLRSAPVADVAGLVTHRAVLLMPQVLGQLLVQGSLQYPLGQLLQQPVRPGQRQALLRARRTSSSAAFCSADGSGLSFLLVWTGRC